MESSVDDEYGASSNASWPLHLVLRCELTLMVGEGRPDTEERDGGPSQT